MSDRTRMTEALQRAVELIGGPSAVARLTGITSQAVGQWGICPPVRVLRIAELSGVPAHELRPDIFTAPPAHLDLPLTDSGENGAAPRLGHANQPTPDLQGSAR